MLWSGGHDAGAAAAATSGLGWSLMLLAGGLGTCGHKWISSLQARRGRHGPVRALSRAYSDVLQGLVNWEQAGIPADAGTANSKAFDLGRMERLLSRLGDPHMQLKAVHVAGSKGKGSTSVLMAEMLRAAGYKVGLYTSPHMQHVSERLSTASCTHMSPTQLEQLVQQHSTALSQSKDQEKGALSHFEALTALAFRHFVDKRVDVAVMETGMGGLTDATNVIPPSMLQVAIITALGYEHAAALGGTLESIAAAKSGIMKPGRPVVIGHQQHPEALQVVLRHAEATGCPAFIADQQVKVKHQGYVLDAAASPSAIREELQITASEQDPQGWSLTATASLTGPHQHANIAAAVTAARQLAGMGWAIGEQHVVAGLKTAFLPGRFQVVSLAAKDTPRHLVLDGAHTRESTAALRDTLQRVFPGQPIVFVVAMAADKEHRAVIDELRACSPRAVIFTSINIAGSSSRSCSPGVLAGHWQAAILTKPGGPRCRQLIQASLPAALEKARHELSAFSEPGVVCVTGSLHAVAEARKIVQGL